MKKPIILFLMQTLCLGYGRAQSQKHHYLHDIKSHDTITLNSPVSNYLINGSGDVGPVGNINIDHDFDDYPRFDTIFNINLMRHHVNNQISIAAIGAKNIYYVNDGNNVPSFNLFLSYFFKGNINIEGTSKNFTVIGADHSSPRNNYTINYVNIADTLLLNKSSCDSLEVSGVNIKTLIIKKFDIYHELTIDGSTFSNIELEDFWFPDTTRLSNIIVKDRAYIKFYYNNPKTFILNNLDFSKWDIPLDETNLLVDTNQSYEKQAILYQTILKKLQNAGLTEKYEQLDKHFQALKLLHEHHWFLNWLTRAWWDYGYAKGRIFYWSIGLFLFFFTCNTVFLSHLKKVYFPKKFIIKEAAKLESVETTMKFLPIIIQMPGTFLYTAYVFWGLRLELKEIEIKHWGAIILILIQYLLGVICLAYLANYVISK